MFEKLKSAIGGFIKAVTEKVEAVTKAPKKEEEPKKKKVEEKMERKELKPKKPEIRKKPVIEVRKPEKEVKKPTVEVKPEVKVEKKPGIAEQLASFVRKTVETTTRPITEQKITEDSISEPLDNLIVSLIEANVALEVADQIAEEIKLKLVGQSVPRGKINSLVRGSIREVLAENLDKVYTLPQVKGRPMVVVIAGINGSGKTTTLAKLVRWFQKKGMKCVIAAADTYRAAAIEQLEIHANRLGTKMIKHDYGADAAAVCFDAIQHAQAHGFDVVLIDTAGRMHADKPLMEELSKIIRVSKPDSVLLVIDSLVGNDAVEQLRIFSQERVDGVILTKSDLDEKGGAALTITTLGTPIAFLGTGQKYDELEVYEPSKFMGLILS